MDTKGSAQAQDADKSGLRQKGGYHTEAGGYGATEDLLRFSSPPDAIFAASDPIAVGALDAMQKYGLSLPDDIGLIGVGNMRYGQISHCSLSTVDQQRIEIGSKAASLLIDLISGKAKGNTRPVLIEPKLIVRTSSSRRSQ